MLDIVRESIRHLDLTPIQRALILDNVTCAVKHAVLAAALPTGSPQADPVILEIAASLAKAEAKHAPMRGHHEGYAVILEELDELWSEVKRQMLDPAKLRKEALHVAAMGARFVKDGCGVAQRLPTGRDTTSLTPNLIKRTWSCGASAIGPASLPVACPVHGEGDTHGTCKSVDVRAGTGGDSSGDPQGSATVSRGDGGSSPYQHADDGPILQGPEARGTDVPEMSRVGLSQVTVAGRETPAPQWQPIETAPKDTRVLGFFSRFGGLCAVLISGTGTWVGQALEHIGEPTHWMPILEPPK